jgi:peptidoglycan/LPS O-acetylase OafA/YrhL
VTALDGQPDVQPPEEATRRVHLGYRPAIDGLRALAVLAVLVYHGNPSWLPGGFLGVDVFFVISGFLITTLLVREHSQVGGIDLPGFWLRRARRLLPAIVVVVAAAGAYALLFADSDALGAIRRDGVATLLYVNNWAQVVEGASYFDAFTAPSPLRHAWSLAIEEQFYFVWPLVVLGMLKLSRGRVRSLVVPTVLLAAGSALLMAALAPATGDPTRAYYGTDTRAQGLLVGAALAFVLHGRFLAPRLQRLVGVAGLVGLAGLLAMAVLVSDRSAWMYDGGFLVVAALSGLTVAAATQPRLQGNVAGLALAVPPLPAIGRISYGIYLWHWPIDVVLTPDRTGLDGVALFVVSTTATFVVAGLSYLLVERPIRLGLFGSRQLLGGLAAAAVGTAALVVVGTMGATSSPRTDLQAESGSGDLVVLVVGDSVAHGLAGNVPDDVGEVVRVRNGGIIGCGITSGDPRPSVDPEGQAGYDRELCPGRLDAWETLVSADPPPDVVVMLTGGYEVFAQEVGGQLLEPETPEFGAFYRAALEEDIELLGSHGAQVVLLTAHCMSEHTYQVDPNPERDDVSRVQWLNEQVEVVADALPEVIVADLYGRVCPNDEHTPVVDGVDLYRDGFHFGQEGDAFVWRWLLDELGLSEQGLNR